MDVDHFTPTFVQALSPRSVEACRRCGVQTNELVTRPFEAFVDTSQDPIRWKLRYHEYEELRAEALSDCRRKRKELIRQAWHPRPRRNNEVVQMNNKGNVTGVMTGMAPQSTKIHDKEQKRVAKVIANQNRELEQQMAQEVKRVALLKKHKEQEEALLERKARLKAEKDKARRSIAKQRRLALMRKEERDEQLEQQKIETAKELFELGKRMQGTLNRKELEKQKQLEEKAKMREERTEQVKQLHQSILKKKEEAALKKKKDMELRDEKRQKQLEKKKKEMQLANEERARQARIRIRMVMDKNEKKLEERRNEASKREESVAQRMTRLGIEQQQRALKKQLNELEKQQHREARAEELKAEREYKALHMMEKHKRADEYRELQEQERDERERMKAELAQLNHERKRILNERRDRRIEHERFRLLDKNYETQRRTTEIEEQRQALIVERQQNDIALREQKRQLQTIFDTFARSAKWTDEAGSPFSQLSRSAVASRASSKASGKSIKSLGHSKSTPAIRPVS